MLDLEAYRLSVALDEPFLVPVLVTDDEIPHLVEQLVTELLADTPSTAFAMHSMPEERLDERELLKALLTIRQPEPWLSSGFHIRMDWLLHYERCSRLPLVTEAMSLPTVQEMFPATRFPNATRCSLWRGDIAALRVDAIVNAANAAMLGCFTPFHSCIDNRIHTVAGPRLREDCQRIMLRQGTPEPTGGAKITRGYHLPASFVLHTVGPIYPTDDPQPSHEDQMALATSYRSCLDLAARLPAIRSLAFCCISTGVFGFPQGPAALVALRTINQWLNEHPGRFDRIILNVFDADDLTIYQNLLNGSR